MNKDSTGLLYTLFADLFSYPSGDMFSIAETCLDELRSVHVEAADELEAFRNGIQNLSVEKIEELYTVTFDMQPVCYPYAGYQLFGESYKRGAFMAQLNEAYHTFGYSTGEELPDHLPVILRFLGLDAANRQGEFCQTLLAQGLIPALEKMLKAFAESQNPYVRLMKALQLVLTQTRKGIGPCLIIFYSLYFHTWRSRSPWLSGFFGSQFNGMTDGYDSTGNVFTFEGMTYKAGGSGYLTERKLSAAFLRRVVAEVGRAYHAPDLPTVKDSQWGAEIVDGDKSSPFANWCGVIHGCWAAIVHRAAEDRTTLDF